MVYKYTIFRLCPNYNHNYITLTGMYLLYEIQYTINIMVYYLVKYSYTNKYTLPLKRNKKAYIC